MIRERIARCVGGINLTLKAQGLHLPFLLPERTVTIVHDELQLRDVPREDQHRGAPERPLTMLVAAEFTGGCDEEEGPCGQCKPKRDPLVWCH